MDASIAAAWIGAGVGGGVALVGVAASIVSSIVNSNNTRRATERTVEAGTEANRATLLAAHEAWLREKRCAVYEEALTGLLYRESRRRNELRGHRWDEASEQQLKDFYNAHEPPAFFEFRARLAAYASDTVLAASNAAASAHHEVRARCLQLEELREQIRTAQLNGTPQSAPDGETMMKANRQINDALEAAGAADDAMIVIIRNELRSRPEAAVVQVPVPARRRGLRRRKAVD